MRKIDSVDKFHRYLQKGAKIGIIVCKILPKAEGGGSVFSDDTLLEDKIVKDITPDYFTVEGMDTKFPIGAQKLHDNRALYQLYSLPFTEPTICLDHDEDEIRFMVTPDLSYSYFFYPTTFGNCPGCKGRGTQFARASVYGKPYTQITLMTCMKCHGKDMSKAEGMEMQDQIDWEKKQWCQCKPSPGSSYVQDGVSDVCSKHHYVCNKCKKITQIG